MQQRSGRLPRGPAGPGWFAYLRETDYVFIHINKTGGSSIEQALGLPIRHFTALEVCAALGEAEWQRRFSFAFVRNPWDKVVSHYHYRLKTNQTGLKDLGMGFAEWVRLSYGEQDPAFFDKPRMFMPQVEWLCDEEGYQLVEFVGRFERLAEDFAMVCARLGRGAALPHVKGSGREHYRGYYDPETRDIVAEWFADDIAAFDYEY